MVAERQLCTTALAAATARSNSTTSADHQHDIGGEHGSVNSASTPVHAVGRRTAAQQQQPQQQQKLLTGTEVRIEKFAAETTTSTQPLQQMHKTRRQRTTETLHAYTLVHTVGEPRSIVMGSCGNVLEV